jgi:MFS family permease
VSADGESGKVRRASQPSRRRRSPAWLSRNVFTLSWVSLLQDAAGEMLYPLMPVFLNTVLGAPAAVIGIIEGAAEGTMAFIKLISDKLNKFLPRKLMVFTGYASATTGSVIIALSLTWPFVLLGRVVDRFGKGLRSAPRDAILMRGTAPRTRGRIIGFHRSMDTAGAVIGPILTLMLLAIFDDNIRAVLWWAVVPAVASTLLVLFIKDGGMRPGRGRSGTADEPLSCESRLDTDVIPAGAPAGSPASAPAPTSSDPLPRKLRGLITVLAIFSLVNFPDALLLLHLSLSGFGPTEVVAVYLVFNIAYALLSFPVGILADRLGSKYVYAFGLVCFAITYGGLALTDDWMIAVALLVVYGGFSAANDTVGKSWAAKLAPAHLQLKAQARLQGFSGFGILIAGIWAGLAWNAGAGIDLTNGLSLGDGGVPLLISAAFAILVAVYVAIFAPRSGLAR